MRSPNIEQGQLVKVDAGWVSGMNTIRHPWLLPESQYRRGVNVVNRGGVVQTRPGFRMHLSLPKGNLQGLTYFRVTKDEANIDHLVFAVDGSIYAMPFPLRQPKDWEPFRINGLSFNPDAEMIYFCDCEKSVSSLSDGSLRLVSSYNVLIIQDGENSAGFWDGKLSGHISEVAPTLGTPRGTWMAFSGNRLWVARGKALIASDFLDPLSFRERTEGEGRGDLFFKKEITGLSNFMGGDQREAVVAFTEESSHIIQSAIQDRLQWAQTPGFQSILFPNTGCIAGRSIVFQAGLMWWYTDGGLVSSDSVAASQTSSEVNFRDSEMAMSKQFLFNDLSGICGASFENFLLISAPVTQNLNSETFVLDYSPMAEYTSDKVPSWASVWTGVRPVQWANARVGKTKRLFVASVDYTSVSDGSHNHIWEAFIPDREDIFFDLEEDFTQIEYRQPIYCEFETRLLGDGQDLKIFRYSELEVGELSGDVSLVVDYRGRRGAYKNILCKSIIAPTQVSDTGAALSNEEIEALGNFNRQTRRLTTQYADLEEGCPTCESADAEGIDKAFSLFIRWCGQLSVESVRIFMEPLPEKSVATCEEDETRVCISAEDGENHSYERDPDFIPEWELYQEVSEKSWSATQTYTETLTCASGSVTGPISVTATATYRSKISQQDAEDQALAIATKSAQTRAAALRVEYPCYFDSVQYATMKCYQKLSLSPDVDTNPAGDVFGLMQEEVGGRFIQGGGFLYDRSFMQGCIAARSSEGYREPEWVNGYGFADFPTFSYSPVVRKVFQGTDGNIIVAGTFFGYNGQSRRNIAALRPNGELNQTVAFDDSPTAFDPDMGIVAGCFSGESIAEVSSVQLVTVSGAGGKYFDVYDSQGAVRVWNDQVDSGSNHSTPPAVPSGGRLLAVETLDTDSVAQALAKFQGVLDSDTEFSCSDDGTDTLTITCKLKGPREIISEPDNGDYYAVSRLVMGYSGGSYYFGGVVTDYLGVAIVSHVFRTRVDGTLDTTFTLPGGTFEEVYDIAVDHDGRVVVIGVDSGASSYITRIISIRRFLSDGSADPSFTPLVKTISNPPPLHGRLGILSDNRIVFVCKGLWDEPGGLSDRTLGLLQEDGTPDASFDTGNNFIQTVTCVLVDSNDNIFVGGNFDTYNSTTKYKIIKLDPTGSLVSGFNSPTQYSDIPGRGVNDMCLSSDESILYIAGGFTSYKGHEEAFKFAAIDANTADYVGLPDMFRSATDGAAYRGSVSQVDSDNNALAQAEMKVQQILNCY